MYLPSKHIAVTQKHYKGTKIANWLIAIHPK